MTKYFENRLSACNVIAAILMVVLLILQFTPFWQYGENQTASVQGYIWFPSDHQELETYFLDTTGISYDVNAVLMPPILMLIVGVIGVVLCLSRSDAAWTAVCPIACGGLTLWGFLTNAVLRLGCTWLLQLLIGSMLLLIGCLMLCWKMKDLRS